MVPFKYGTSSRGGNGSPITTLKTKTKNTPPSPFQPGADFKDPRLRPGFQPKAWPLCNGAAAPLPKSADLHERRCIEFLAFYYKLNVLNRRLLEAREKSAAKKIKSILAEIEAATSALERLEDRYAPIGFYGEPVMDGVFYQNILFVRPELPQIYPQPASQCSHIAIPGLDEIPKSELRGPVKVMRFVHGKVAL